MCRSEIDFMHTKTCMHGSSDGLNATQPHAHTFAVAVRRKLSVLARAHQGAKVNLGAWKIYEQTHSKYLQTVISKTYIYL